MSLNKKLLVSNSTSTKSYIYVRTNKLVSMLRTTLTLSEPLAKTLKVYTAKTKISMLAQSEVVEEALREFFERYDVQLEG